MDMIWAECGAASQEGDRPRAVMGELGSIEQEMAGEAATVVRAVAASSRRTRRAGRPYRWSIVLLLCLLGTLGQSAWATGCKTVNGYPKVFNLALPGSSVMVPRDSAIGTTLAVVNGPMLTAGSSTNSATWFAQCNTPNGTVNGVLTSTPWPLVSQGIYQTNVAGVGVRIQRNTLTVPGSMPYTPANFPGVTSAPYGWYWYANPVFVYTFIKTGPISGGTVTAADVPTIGYNFDSNVTVFTSTVSGQIQFTVGACVTPDVQVSLDPASAKDFTGVGSTAGAKSFNIAVNGCPPGLTSVAYQLDAASGITVINGSQGVIGLGGAASAKGVALQIKDANNNAVGLGVMRATAGYNTTSGGSFAIPLKTMYYQTANPVTAGSVVSQAVFTMSYQ